MKYMPQNTRGFGLIEAMAGVAVISVVLAASSAMNHRVRRRLVYTAPPAAWYVRDSVLRSPGQEPYSGVAFTPTPLEVVIGGIEPTSNVSITLSSYLQYVFGTPECGAHALILIDTPPPIANPWGTLVGTQIVTTGARNGIPLGSRLEQMPLGHHAYYWAESIDCPAPYSQSHGGTGLMGMIGYVEG